MYNPCFECLNRHGHSYTEKCDSTCSDAYDARMLKSYKNTGLSPEEIEQMKARMPLHQWAGESANKMSIFGVTVSRLMELAKADQEGRLVIFSIENLHPCRGCNNGWGTISSEGCTTCEETCVRLKEYYEKYST